jgi:GDPmannose 4,6-dehydratase
VRDLVEVAFAHVGLDWRAHVRTDPSLVRGSAELHDLVGSPTKARSVLSWEPSLQLSELIELLVDSELEHLSGVVDVQSTSSA